MRILCIGDVCGSIGCDFLRQRLPSLKKQRNIDMVVVNGENSADGNGILPASAAHLYDSGAHVITGGNHTFRRREIFPLLEEDETLLRPANFPAGAPGRGIAYVDFGYVTVAVISLLGVVYMEPLDCPFHTADALVPARGSSWSTFTPKPPPKNGRSASIWTAEYPPSSAPTPMCKRPTPACCRRGRGISPTSA